MGLFQQASRNRHEYNGFISLLHTAFQATAIYIPWYNPDMPNFKTLADLGDIAGKTVLLRADLDVPVEGEEVTENFRLVKALPTIKELVKRKAKIVIIGHRGRPEGKYADEFSLLPVRFELGKLLGMHIKFAHIPNSRNSIRYMENGEVLMLENVRFHPEEESESKKERTEFVNQIAELVDIYINDAFSSYRAHASTYDMAFAVKTKVAGMQLEAEINNLSRLKDNPDKPYVAVIGGAKLDTKIDILTKLAKQADYILLGGAMAYTFMAASGIATGDSKIEKDKLDEAKKVIETAKKNKCEILLPIDHVCAAEFDEKAKPVYVENQVIPKGMIGLDIGDKTLAQYLEIIKSAKSILWNGPMGVFEWLQFSRGTEAVGEYIALSAPQDTFKVAGGGDTISAMNKLKINMRNFKHVSTGGGAMLAFLAGEKMPTIEALSK